MFLNQLLLNRKILMVVFLAIWAISFFDPAWAAERALEKALSVGAPQETQTFSGETPTGVITLMQALSLVGTHNPELKAFSLAIREKEARVMQANRLPNPEIEVEVEEFGGSDNRTGFDSAETTVQFSQLFLLGGKRAKATKTATLEKNLADWEYKSKRLDILTQTAEAFINLLEAQKRLEIADGYYQLAQEMFDVVSERVGAGKVSPVEQTKAEVALATSEIDLNRAKRELEIVRSGLAAKWGSTSPSFVRAEGDIEAVRKPISLDQLQQQVMKNPDLVRWRTELELSRAVIESEKADAIPDLTVSAGVQQFEETDDNAYIVGLSIPIPLFNRNRGSIQAAEHSLNKSIQEKRAMEVGVRSALDQVYQSLSSSYHDADTLKNKVLPAAHSAFHATREGYKQGKLKYLDVLDAQRTLFDTEARYISAVAAYQRSRLNLERLVGKELKTDDESL